MRGTILCAAALAVAGCIEKRSPAPVADSTSAAAPSAAKKNIAAVASPSAKSTTSIVCPMVRGC